METEKALRVAAIVTPNTLAEWQRAAILKMIRTVVGFVLDPDRPPATAPTDPGSAQAYN